MSPWVGLCSLVLGCFASSGAIAQENPSQPEPLPPPKEPREHFGADAELRKPRGGDDWDLKGQGRVRYVTMPDYALDTLGTRNDRQQWLETRLILGGNVRVADWLKVFLELDAFNGTAAGDLTDLATARGDDSFNFRRDESFGGGVVFPRLAYLQLDLPFGRVLLGQQAFSWGLGLLANDGAGEPDFGDTYYGSLIERVLFATQPFKHDRTASELARGFAFFLGADIPLRDDNASLLEDDFAWGAVAGVRLKTRRFELGALEVMRRQQDRSDPYHPGDPELNVFVTDVYTKLFFTDPEDDHVLRAEAEAALVLGDTTRPYLDETFEDGASVFAGGGALVLRYDNNPARFTAKLEAGYASGDNDPRDDTFRQFTFNTDYNVGLVLFDHVLPMLSARAVDRIVDPGLTAVPPASTRHLVNQGAVQNTTYLHPRVLWRPIYPLDLRLGYVYAQSAGDFIDPYNSARNGGFNATYGGSSPGSRVLGHEVDASARFGIDVGADIVVRVGAEGGVFFPGAAFDGLETDPIWIGRGLADVSF